MRREGPREGSSRGGARGRTLLRWAGWGWGREGFVKADAEFLRSKGSIAVGLPVFEPAVCKVCESLGVERVAGVGAGLLENGRADKHAHAEGAIAARRRITGATARTGASSRRAGSAGSGASTAEWPAFSFPEKLFRDGGVTGGNKGSDFGGAGGRTRCQGAQPQRRRRSREAG